MTVFLGSEGQFREDVAFEALNTAKAWDMLHDPEVTRDMRTTDFMDLCRRAGYGEDATQKAGKSWANGRLDQNKEP